MALFNSSKKTPACACNCGSPTSETTICCIKVLGAGCASCHQLYKNTKEAVKNIGLPIEVEYITDMAKVMAYGIMSMPALIVNENVASMGKVLKVADVEKLLCKFNR